MEHQILKPRVRFAPSPTGNLHIGGLRTTLFNWLFARHNQGSFLLRIEDTDAVRSKQEYVDSIIGALAWCGIDYDEELVVQSQRLREYQRVAQEMLQRGTAYRCFCTAEELTARLGASAATGEGYALYDEKCRNRVESSEDSNKPFVIRFKIIRDQEAITFNDLIHHEVSFPLNTIDDFIILRSDGNPTYNFAVVIDDAFMHITHVIRGEEHLVNTPRQILLYKACKYTVPVFAHLPLILGPDGSKLSKRDAATSVLEYKYSGFLPQALCNYLVRLGWAHGDQEIFTLDELIKAFTLEAVGKKGSIFDIKKLEWLNGVYIRQTADQELLSIINKDINASWQSTLSRWNDQQILEALRLYKDRSAALIELMKYITLLHDGPTVYNCPDTVVLHDVIHYVRAFKEQLEKQTTIDRAGYETLVKQVCAELSIKLPLLAQPIRCALTGGTASPSIYDMMVLIGKQEVLSRLTQFIEKNMS